MVTINETNFKIDENYIIEQLKIIGKLIVDVPKQLIKKINDNKAANTISLTAKNATSSNLEIEFKEGTTKLYNRMDSFADTLNKNKYFHEEYYDFREIQDITKDTLNKGISSIESSDMDFIYDLIISFLKFIDNKVSLLKSNEFNEYEFESIYCKYLVEFDKSKEYYYKNICDEDIDNELFLEYCKIIQE